MLPRDFLRATPGALLPAIAFVLLALASPAEAAWPAHPDSGGLALCTAPDWQWYPQMLGDGAGGTFVVWRDDRNRTASQPYNYDVYAQHVNAAGVPLWGADGLPVCTNFESQDRPALCSDGEGGLFVVWSDPRTGNSEIFGQRIDATGTARWTANGLRVARLDTNTDLYPQVVSDGVGGMVALWSSYDPTPPASTRLRAQRMSAAGFQLWGSAGRAAGGLAGNQSDLRLASDGAGGALLSWVQASTPRSVRALRLDGSGLPLWDANGIAITDTTSAASRTHYLLPDGAGGARFIVHDTGLLPTPWMRHVDATGTTTQWLQPFPGNAWSTIATAACAADSGATLVLCTNGGFESIQRVAADGTMQWGPHGLAISPDTLYRMIPLAVAPDGAGGALTVGTFYDTLTWYKEIRAQHVKSDQTLAWVIDGIPLSNAITGDQEAPMLLGAGAGAIALWQDYRTVATTGVDLYMQRIDASGLLGLPTLGVDDGAGLAALEMRAPWPNPSRPGAVTTLRYSLPGAARAELSLFDVTGRRVSVLADGPHAAGEHTVRIDGDAPFAPGLYFARLVTPFGTRTQRIVRIR